MILEVLISIWSVAGMLTYIALADDGALLFLTKRKRVVTVAVCGPIAWAWCICCIPYYCLRRYLKGLTNR